MTQAPLSLLGWGTRLIGSVAAAAAAIAWLWLIVDPESAGRAGDLSLFGLLYAALGIAANLAASATYARIRVEVDGLAWGLTLVAGVATVTLFSQDSPIGRLSPTAATVLLVLVVLQGAALLLLQRPRTG